MPEERRVVTLLFADMANSTAFGDANDPEDVRAVLRRYYELAKDVVETHGGTVEKFIGDAVMAIFGLPVAHGDDAERALAAALAIRSAVADDPVTARLQLRFGINTGEVVGARGGSGGDFLVTGDAVNIAARLQQHADVGEILVGERTRMAAAAAFDFGPGVPLAVRGKGEPLQAAPLIARSRSASLGTRRATTPFIGRSADLEQLELLARRAFAEARPQLVSVTAPAGTGKSRLIEEFLLRLSRVEERSAVAIAQCLPYGSAVTYLPLRGIVTGLFGTDDDEQILGHVRRTLLEAGHEEADASRIAGLVGATLGRSSEVEERERDEFFGAWRVLVEAIAATRRLIVVFEDLHWASNSLLDLVDHVTLPRTRAPLMMIALGRPELLDRRPQWGAARRNFSALGLEPLSELETSSLVGLLLPDAPDALRARIAERSGGNAFFAGELSRAYGKARVPSGPQDEVLLPDTVQATVLARLDTLAELPRRALQQAAIGGRSVPREAVVRLLDDVAAAEVHSALDDLAERELLDASGPRAYTFAHIVIREVAYSTLPRSERVRGHLRLAAWLESGDAESQDELIAYHYRQAIAMAPSGRPLDGEEAARAVAAFARGGRSAKALGARAEAVELLRDAIRIAPEDQHLGLHELLGDISEWGDEATEAYAAAFERWRALEPGARDPLQGVRLLRKEALVHARWAGSISRVRTAQEVDELVAQARQLLLLAPSAEEQARLDVIASFHTRTAPLEESQELELMASVRRSHAHFVAASDANAASEALDALGSLHLLRGEFDDSLAASRERLRHVAQLTLMERADAWNMGVWGLVWAGRYREAMRMAEELKASFRPGEPEENATHGFAWAALAARLDGSWDAALRYADQMRTWWENLGRPPSARFSLRGVYAGIHVARARGDEARLAAYRGLAESGAFLAALPKDHPYVIVHAMAASGRGAASDAAIVMARHDVLPEYKGEILALLTLERPEALHEPGFAAALDAAERVSRPATSLLSTRIALARALLSGSESELAAAVSGLDAAGLLADGARAAAVLALQRGDASGLAEAQRRLTALRDRLFLSRLRERR